MQNSTYENIPLDTFRLCITFMKNGIPQIQEWMLDTSIQSGESVPFQAVMQDKSIPADAQIRVTAQIDERVISSNISYRELIRLGSLDRMIRIDRKETTSCQS